MKRKCFAKSTLPAVWCGVTDRLYLMHPRIRACLTTAMETVWLASRRRARQRTRVRLFRPAADHTTNGLSLGPADGMSCTSPAHDFGFLEAVDSDGKKTYHRGGGVLRVRPDGSDLQIYFPPGHAIFSKSPDQSRDGDVRSRQHERWGRLGRAAASFHGHGNRPAIRDFYKNFHDQCVQDHWRITVADPAAVRSILTSPDSGNGTRLPSQRT